MNLLFDIIPVKSSHIDVLPYDGKGHLIVHKKLNYHLNVNQLVINLLSLIDGRRTILELSKDFAINFKKDISPEKVHEILYDTLGKYHIIENDKYEYAPLGKPDYLKLSTTVLKKKWMAPITKLMSPLFSRSLFYTSLLVSFCFIVTVGLFRFKSIYNDIFNNGVSLNLPLIALVSIISLFLHEFGHASACRYYGAEHGEIGFGFYLLSPVMYADVSNVWKLRKKERIIVNLAGLYIQILMAGFFGILFLVNGGIDFLALMYLLGLISVVFNLNPFFRTDGYWVLSDITGVYNLRRRSNKKVFEFFKWITKKGNFIFTKTNVFLTLYAITSMSFVFVFLGMIIVNDFSSLLSFPLDFYNFLKNLLLGDQKVDFHFLKQSAVFFLFYFLTFKLLRTIYIKRIAKLESIQKKELFSIGVSTLLSTIYLLSGVGKTIGFSSFVENVKQYPIYFNLLPHLIITLEYILAFGFVILLYRNFVSQLSTLFLTGITLVYIYGFFVLDIQECSCFGSLAMLNSNNFGITIGKNVILIFLSFYIMKNNLIKIRKYTTKVLVPMGVIIFLSFQVVNFNSYSSSNYSLEHIGSHIEDMEVFVTKEMRNSEYWFLFSPSCPHCKNAIPNINVLSKDSQVLGVTLEDEVSNWKQFMDELEIEFPIITIDKNEFLKMTRRVPVLFQIKKDTLANVFKSHEILEQQAF